MLNQSESHPLLPIVARAEKAVRLGDYQKAIKLFNQVINDRHSEGLETRILVGCYHNRGLALRETGCYNDALRDWQKASELNPRSFAPHLNAGLIYAKDLQQYQKAIIEFNETLQLDPTNVVALSARGLVKMLLGDMPGAETDMNTALSIEPNSPDALCNLGNLYAERQQFERAAELYKRALEGNPHDAEIRLNLALALKHMGSHQAADNVLREDKNALRLWRQKSGEPAPPQFSFFPAFLKTCVPLYALLVGGLASFTSQSLDDLIVGAIFGVILGVISSGILTLYAKSKPGRDWSKVMTPDWPFPDRSKAEVATWVTGAFLGAFFGLIGSLIVNVLIGPVSQIIYYIGPLFGFGLSGAAVQTALRKLSLRKREEE